MAGTYTSRGNLYKTQANGDDNVDPVLDLNNNWDRLDALLGWRPVTSGTMPASAFQGASFLQTNTGKGFVNTSSGASAVYAQVMVAGSDYASNITMASSAQQIAIGGSSSSAPFTARRGSISDVLVSGQVASASANNTFVVTVGGTMTWGPGSAGGDTNLYRSSANTLATDDSLQVGANLTVAGSATMDDAIVGGEFILNGTKPRPALSGQTTVASTTTNTAIATLSIPAADAVAGATYEIEAWGSAAVAAATTPTLTFGATFSTGVSLGALPAITCRSGMTNGKWRVKLRLACITPGASGTWTSEIESLHNFLTGATTATVQGPEVIDSATKDSTVLITVGINAAWGTANASNTLTCRGFLARRVA